MSILIFLTLQSHTETIIIQCCVLFFFDECFPDKGRKRPKHKGGLLHDFTFYIIVSTYCAAVGLDVKNNVPRRHVHIYVHKHDNKLLFKGKTRKICVLC